MSIRKIKLRNRKEMKKSLQKFGEPLTITTDNKIQTKGFGLFTNIEKKANVGLLNEQLDFYLNPKFVLWLYSFKTLKSIDCVTTSNNETFEIKTGFYDDNIGCWRLIVQKCY